MVPHNAAPLRRVRRTDGRPTGSPLRCVPVELRWRWQCLAGVHVRLHPMRRNLIGRAG
jgi:hypothetical protein